MTSRMDDPVGGYFAWEACDGSGMDTLRAAAGFQSARSAMAALLQAAGARTAWVPYFICSAVTDALAFAGVQVRHYPLSGTLGVPDDLPLAPDDWLVCVDYFGLNAGACDAAIERYGAQRVLVDASQALFHAPRQGASTVYSPRKFVGVPDGGLLVTPLQLPLPAPADEVASTDRSRHLASRAAGDLAGGYEQFQHAESSLADCSPAAMSQRTRRMLDTIDFAGVRDRRIANYGWLADELRGHGFAVPDLPGGAVPLCCPVYRVDAPALRPALASRKIFAPSYWNDADVPPHDQLGSALKATTLYLPCDQRYGEVDMRRVAQSLLEIGDAP